jgi:methylmalonyl-CoA mutase N-terminal domain/subunit
VAVRTQQIVRDEAGVRDVIDPLGGSWAIESLTCDIERRVWELLGRIDGLGGAVACVTSGWFASELADGAYRDQLDVESGRRVVIGVNSHRDPDERIDTEVFSVDPRSEERQIARLERVRAERDGRAVARTLDAVEAAARAGRNVVEPVIDAVEAYATVGEISDRLGDVFGRFSAHDSVS